MNPRDFILSALKQANLEYPNPKADREQLSQFLKRLTPRAGECVEIRILGDDSSLDFKKRQKLIGFYDDVKIAAQDCLKYHGEGTVCVGLNARKGILLHTKACNQLRKGNGGTNEDVPARRVFPIDIDVAKPAKGVASSDEEIIAALPILEAIYDDLRAHGISPIMGFSGNGFHLLVETVPYPGSEEDDGKESLSALLLRHFAKKYSTQYAEIDVTIFDRARVLKVYGTAAVKGGNTQERPWRTAKFHCEHEAPPADILSIYQSEICEQKLFESKDASPGPGTSPKSEKGGWAKYGGDISKLNIVALFKSAGKYGEHIKKNMHSVNCPWSAAHTTGLDGDSSTVIYEAVGESWPGFDCKHSHCHGRTLQAALSTFSAEDVDRHCSGSFGGARSSEQAGESWGTPLPLLEYALPPFPSIMEPEWLGAFTMEVSRSLEVPYELVWSFAMASVSVACARIYRLQVKPNYFEPINIWTCVALEPGNRKSAAFGICTEPLMQWQRTEAARLKPEIDAAKSKRKSEESLVNGLRLQLAKKKEEEREKLKQEIAEIERSCTGVPVAPELWTSDCTPERLGVLLHENDERYGFLSDEGGVFETLGGRYSGGIPNLDLFLKAHAGSADHTARMGRTVNLEAPALTMGISPQPSVLQDLANNPSFRGRGLLGRFLFTLPPSPLGSRTGETPPIPQSVLAEYNRAMRAMLSQRPVRDEKGSIQMKTLQLSSQAYDLWFQFWLETEKKFLEYGELEAIKDWGGKLPGAAARLAGLLHLAKNAYDETSWKIPVSDSTMDNAIDFARSLSKHALAVFGLMGADSQMEGGGRVLRWIKTKDIHSFSQRECHHALQSHFKRVGPLEESLALLVERDLIRECPKPRAAHRTGRAFNVNPGVHG